MQRSAVSRLRTISEIFNRLPRGYSEYLACVKAKMERLLHAAVPSPSKEAMISPSRNVKAPSSRSAQGKLRLHCELANADFLV